MGLMHEALWATWCGWVAPRSSRPCARDRGVQPPSSCWDTAFLVFCFSHPLIPSYWVTGSWGFSQSSWKRYCKCVQVPILCFVAFSQFCFLLCTHLSILFLSFPFPIIVVREGKETLQKWKISLLYHKDELCNHFPLSKELKDNKSPN